MLMVSSSSSLLPSRSRLKDGGVRLQQQRQRHRASGLREGPTRRARLLPRPRRLGGLPRAGGTLSEEEEEEQELLLSEEVFERKGCMLLVSTPTQRPRPDDSAFHFVYQSSADSSRAALCTVSSLSRQDSASCFAFRVKKKGKREGRERERERDDCSSKIWGKTLTVAPVLASRLGCCCSGDHAPRAAVRALVSCERFRPRRSADAAGKHHHRPGVFEERKRERARALTIDDASEVFSCFSASPRKTVSEEFSALPQFSIDRPARHRRRAFFFFPRHRAQIFPFRCASSRLLPSDSSALHGRASRRGRWRREREPEQRRARFVIVAAVVAVVVYCFLLSTSSRPPFSSSSPPLLPAVPPRDRLGLRRHGGRRPAPGPPRPAHRGLLEARHGDLPGLQGQAGPGGGADVAGAGAPPGLLEQEALGQGEAGGGALEAASRVGREGDVRAGGVCSRVLPQGERV